MADVEVKLESYHSDLDLWSVEDAAEAAGISRQRLGELLLRGDYPHVVVPYRKEDGSMYGVKDAAGRVRSFRTCLIKGDVVRRMVAERADAQNRQAEMEAAAIERRKKDEGKPKRGPGRPRKEPVE